MVTASAARLIEVLHPCLSKHKIAEIKVPQNTNPKTKLTIAHPQLIGFAETQTPTRIH